MPGGFVHQIDPIFAEVGGVYLWWYGLGYALGFIETYLWLRRARARLCFSAAQVYDFTILIALGVLVGGRLVEVAFYEWPYYRLHLTQIPAAWLGGMSTHGVLLGGILAIWLFSRLSRQPFFVLADELAVPGAFLMGMGRIGNFIDGQIVGRITDVGWAVKFPDAVGFRHPVVLYDGLKNFLLIPLLLAVRKRRPVRGIVTAHFIFWYGFLRIFVDIFREYPTTLLGIATGQNFNILMSLVGAFLFVWLPRREVAKSGESPPLIPTGAPSPAAKLWARRIILVALLLFSLTLPSDWTQDIPARYGARHSGLHYSSLYPRVR